MVNCLLNHPGDGARNTALPRVAGAVLVTMAAAILVAVGVTH